MWIVRFCVIGPRNGFIVMKVFSFICYWAYRWSAKNIQQMVINIIWLVLRPSAEGGRNKLVDADGYVSGTEHSTDTNVDIGRSLKDNPSMGD